MYIFCRAEIKTLKVNIYERNINSFNNLFESKKILLKKV